MLQVVAAIIEREGRILVGQRTAAQSHPLKWEFPGGKVEPLESPEQALERELDEELGIRSAAGEEMTRYRYTYPGKYPIELIFVRVHRFEGEPANLIFRDLRWQPKGELRELDFVEGDRQFIDAIDTAPSILVPMATAIKRIDPAENEFLASLEAKAKKPNPFLRAMANRPDVLKSFVPFYGAVVGPGSVERRIKMMVYLVCSFANKCPFCIASNLPGARKAGMTEEEIQALEHERDESFSEPERAVIRYARELTRTASAGAAREEMFRHFTHEQVVEITLVVAMSNFTNRFNNGLAIFPRLEKMALLSGIHPVAEALRSGNPLERIVIAQGAGGPRLQEIIDLARQAKVPVRFEPRSSLDRLAGSPAHQGVVGLGAARKYADLDSVAASAMLVVLDGVEDPHNLGAIVRTAHAAGAGAVIVPERRAAGVTDVVAKAAAGALEHLPVVRVTNINRALEDLKERGMWIYGLDERGTEAYDQIDYAPRSALVLGGEGKGLHEQVRKHCDVLVRIPMAGKISSLNVSVAAGVVLFEWKRRRAVQ